MIYCTRLRKLTPTLIAFDFGCAFVLGLKDDSRTVCEGGGSSIKLLTTYVGPADSGQLTVFTAQTHIRALSQAKYLQRLIRTGRIISGIYSR